LAKSLDDLRKEVERIDREIMDLVGRRMRAVKRIGQMKIDASLAIRNMGVEEEVLSRYGEMAAEKGIATASARQIAGILIREAVEAQSRLPRSAPRKRIMVVGGAGKMGSWICRHLASRGHQVAVEDRTRSNEFPLVADFESSVRDSDFIIVATPISVVKECLQRVIDLRPEGVVFDISSLKTPVIPALRKAVEDGIMACSVHPMFGPSAESVYDRNIVVCDCGSPEASDRATELLDGTLANIVRIPIEEHDELMAYVLGLSHALNLAFFNALQKTGIDFDTLNEVASTTFRRQVATSRDVAFENPELYYEIQRLNPENRKALDLLIQAVEEVRRAGISEDKEMLLNIMMNGRQYFGGR